MEWSNLSILNATTVQKECEMAINLLQTYLDDHNPKLGSFVESVKKRIDELEVFYAANDDDDRAILFERERMKLRKALQSIIGNITIPTIKSNTISTANETVKSGSRLEKSDLQSSTRTINERQSSISPARSVGADNFLVSPRAVAQSKAKAVEPEKMTKKHANQIYAWESGHQTREKIQVDDDSFVPTSSPGVYIREDGLDQTPSTEKWTDVKIVLTQEELTTLASRKKALRRVKGMGLNSTNFFSIQSSTPYIDPRRIVKETYRPDHPEKWIAPVYNK